MTDHLAQLLIREVFGGGFYVKCGPNHEHKVFPSYVEENYSSFIDGTKAPHIVPDRTYHPEVYAIIDFSHQFVLPTDGGEYKGRRPVDKEVLKNAAISLLKFFSYYFDYVLSYGKDNRIQYWINRLKNMEVEESDILPFINTIVNYFIISVNVQRSRIGISNCSVTLRDNPNYRNNKRINIFLNKALDILNQIFVPMLPISIWAKGRLYKDWYFPIFDGYLMNMTPANRSGFTEITLNCNDVLELARISQEMINPAIIQIEEFRKQTNVNIFAQPLYGLDHMTIFNIMFHGGKIAYTPDGGGKLLDVDEVSGLKDSDKHKGQFANFSALGNFAYAREGESSSADSITPGDLADQKAIRRDNSFGISKLLRMTSHYRRPRRTCVWGEKITPYRILQFQTPNIFTSEFSNRLDIIRDVAGMVYYELYVDGHGNVNYHPMRLANDYLISDIIYEVDLKEKRHACTFPGAQIVGAEEVLNTSTSLNIEEMVTFLRLAGVHSVVSGLRPELAELVGSAIDKTYMERYGYRRDEIRNPLFNENPDLNDFGGKKCKFLDMAAMSLLKYKNSELFSRTVSMIGRPEIELASPVLFTDDNNVFYVQSLSHSITIGGEFTTTINTNFGRKDYQHPPDLASFILLSERMYKSNVEFVNYEHGAIDFVEVWEAYKTAEQNKYQIPNESWINKQNTEQESVDEMAASIGIGSKSEIQEARKKERERKAVEKREATQNSRENAERRRASEEAQKRLLSE